MVELEPVIWARHGLDHGQQGEGEEEKKNGEYERGGLFAMCVCVFWFGKRERNVCVEVGIYGVVVPFSFFLF